MESQVRQKDYQNIDLRIVFFKFLKKAILPSLLLCLFFLIIPNHIKAQIASIISEDGDGIVGITSLMNATINDDTDAVKFFAKSGAAIVNQKNVGGASALNIAARKGNIEICKILLENGANINITDNEGWTPLMRAALAKNADLVRMLILQGADPRKMNSTGETVIINSASAECSACLEQVFSGYNFIENLNIDILRKQLEEAMIIANNKNDLASQSIIKEYFNSEVNKSKIYSLTNNRSLEMPITPNNSRGDGVVMVRSLDDMNQRSRNAHEGNISGTYDNRPVYKFLPNKTTNTTTPPYQFSPPTRQKNDENYHSNTINNSDQQIANSPLLNKNPNTIYKKFIFKGDKKPFTPLNFKSSQNTQPKTKPTNKPDTAMITNE